MNRSKPLFLFFGVLMLISIISCNKDPEIINQNPIYKIDKIEKVNNNQTFVETFEYNNDLLQNIDIDEIVLTKRVFNYDLNDKLLTIDFLSEMNQIYERDSLIYDGDDRVESIIKKSAYPTGAPTDLYEYKYFYNSKDEIIKEESRQLRTGDFFGSTEYEWDNGNISQAIYKSASGDKIHEYFYEYDNKINFKKNNPFFINNVLNTTENNVVLSNVIDYTGLLDLICYECVTEYTYNNEDLPVEIIYEYGTTLKITYQ